MWQQGRVQARKDVVLSFEEGGIVERLYYDAGDKVSVGTIIASLDSGTLGADLRAQQANLERETVRLASLDGPERLERARVEADTEVSKQVLESNVRAALVSAQELAVSLEGLVHTDLDTLFDGVVGDLRFAGSVSPLTQQHINSSRDEIDTLFNRWGVWSSASISSYKGVTSLLDQFERDLRTLHEGVERVYDGLLLARSLNQESGQGFLLASKVRGATLDALVNVTQQNNLLQEARARHALKVAELDEFLGGGTESGRLVQAAQVEFEREQLNRLGLEVGKRRVIAPFSGVIGDVFVRVGEFVSVGDSAVRFISSEGFELSVDVTEIEVDGLVKGQEVRAVIGATGTEVIARVRTIDRTEQHLDGVPVYTVIFDIVTDIASLRSGMTVDVYVPSGEIMGNIFTIPRTALRILDGREYVMLKRDGVKVEVPVESIGSQQGNFTTVVGEIMADDNLLLRQDG